MSIGVGFSMLMYFSATTCIRLFCNDLHCVYLYLSVPYIFSLIFIMKC